PLSANKPTIWKPSAGLPHIKIVVGMAQIPPSLAHPKFLLCDQLHFSRRFIRLFTGSGLRLGNAARNNLAAVLDDFPIPVAIFPIGHDAEFNGVSHGRLGPSARKDCRGTSGHSLLCRTQSTRRREGPARGPEEKYQPLFPSSRRTACRPGLTAPPYFSCPSPLRSQRIDGPDGSPGGSLGFG